MTVTLKTFIWLDHDLALVPCVFRSYSCGILHFRCWCFMFNAHTINSGCNSNIQIPFEAKLGIGQKCSADVEFLHCLNISRRAMAVKWSLSKTPIWLMLILIVIVWHIQLQIYTECLQVVSQDIQLLAQLQRMVIIIAQNVYIVIGIFHGYGRNSSKHTRG